MKKTLLATMIGSALIAAPVTFAQQTYDPATRGMGNLTDGRSGGTNLPSATSGAVPSTSPLQGQVISSGGAPTTSSGGPVISSSGAPVLSAYPANASGVTAAPYYSTAIPTTTEPYAAGSAYGRTYENGAASTRVSEYSLTDGRSGGTNVPSATSGAVPSTSPNADLEQLHSRMNDRSGGYGFRTH